MNLEKEAHQILIQMFYVNWWNTNNVKVTENKRMTSIHPNSQSTTGKDRKSEQAGIWGVSYS